MKTMPISKEKLKEVILETIEERGNNITCDHLMAIGDYHEKTMTEIAYAVKELRESGEIGDEILNLRCIELD